MAQIVGDKNIGEAIRTVDSLLDEHDLSVAAQDDFDVLSERFHRLVDKEFLGTLTPEETEELAGLTRWQEEQGKLIYQSMMGASYTSQLLETE